MWVIAALVVVAAVAVGAALHAGGLTFATFMVAIAIVFLGLLYVGARRQLCLG